MKNLDIMVDIETLAKKNCIILQISAAAFNLKNSEIYSEFDQFINPKSCIDAGLKSDGDTVNWVLSQEPEMINSVLIKSIQEGRNLKDVLKHFSNWVNKVKRDNNCKEATLWANGPSFDHVNLQNAYECVNEKYPIKFYNVQSVRTICELGKRLLDVDYKKQIVKEEGGSVAHIGIADVKQQIRYCSKIYQELEKLK